MPRPAPRHRPILSSVVLASYLCAAFLDCEPIAPPPRFALVETAVERAHDAVPGHEQAVPSEHAGHDAGHGRRAHAEGTHAAHTAAHAGGGHGAHAATHAGGGHGAQAATHAGGGRGAHAATQAPGASHADSTERSERRGGVHRAVRVASSHAVMKATCSCGCGETRARVGGGASRLGAVVPGVFVPRLTATVHVDGHPPTRGLVSEPFSELDPIPI